MPPKLPSNPTDKRKRRELPADEIKGTIEKAYQRYKDAQTNSPNVLDKKQTPGLRYLRQEFNELARPRIKELQGNLDHRTIGELQDLRMWVKELEPYNAEQSLAEIHKKLEVPGTDKRNYNKRKPFVENQVKAEKKLDKLREELEDIYIKDKLTSDSIRDAKQNVLEYTTNLRNAQDYVLTFDILYNDVEKILAELKEKEKRNKGHLGEHEQRQLLSDHIRDPRAVEAIMRLYNVQPTEKTLASIETLKPLETLENAIEEAETELTKAKDERKQANRTKSGSHRNASSDD